MFCLLLLSVAVAALSQVHGSLYDEQTVYVRQVATGRARRSTLGGPLPPTLSLEVVTERGEVTSRLLLQRNSRLPEDLPVTFDRPSLNQRAKPAGDRQTLAFYHDTRAGAAITVERRNNKDVYHGIFEHEGEVYELSPEDAPASDVTASPRHVTRRLQPDKQTYEASEPRLPDYLRTVPPSPYNLTSGARYSASSSYEVELLFYLDATIYLHWLRRMGGHDEAVRKMKLIYTSYINAMDLSYKLIGEDGYGIDIRLVPWGLHILTSRDESLPTEMNIIGHSSPYRDERDTVIDQDKALAALPKLLHQIGTANRRPDHLMYWTRYNLGQSMEATATIGYAYPDVVCDVFEDYGEAWGVSLVQDTGYIAWRTAAHELGHNLGMYHDTEECGQEYIMSPFSGYSNDPQSNLRFSPCTINQMISNLRGTKFDYKEPKLCLQDTDCSRRAYLPGSQYLPGQEHSLEEQCQLHFNEDYTPCKAYNNDYECMALYCQQASWEECESADTWADGTPCGNDPDKWCIKGHCELKSEAIEHDINDRLCSDGTLPDKDKQDPDLQDCYDRWENCDSVDREYCLREEYVTTYWCCSKCRQLLQ